LPLILAVDDEQSGLYFRKLILEHAGYTVLSATTVQEALELFRSNPIDLVVTDHLLGRQMGTDMAREMKHVKPAVPIVLLSGTSSVPEPLEHANAFLSKTEGPEELLELVKRLLPSSTKQSSVPRFKNGDAATLQALLAAIVEDSDDAIFSKTLDGSILTWNRAAERMYGYRSEEIIGQKVAVLLPPERQGEDHEILQRLARGEKIEHRETIRRAKDGSILNVSLTISPVRDAQGNIIAASTIARDITRMKLSEHALRNSESLAVAGRMAATIAHEINNPLEAVTNVLYLLERNSSLDETARTHVKTAAAELRRVGQVTRTTLGFYRERDTAMAPVNLIELIDSILLLYDRRVRSVGAQVHKRFDSATRVMGVSGELRQVFSNLIVNAIDALTLSGTTLVVHVRDSIDWRQPSRRGVRVTVADDGPGMSAENRKNLFQPFYTTKGKQGTGLGLWVSQGIVSKHGGSIAVRSSPGLRHGTFFTVFLPTAASPSAST
jgi:PAS domain S-box-containing protein